MRQFRLVLSLALLLSLLLSTCSPTAAPAAPSTEAEAVPAEAIDPYGKYESPIVMTTVRSLETNEQLPVGDSPENNQYTRYVKDTLDIDVEYLGPSSTADYDQKVNLSIASNDLPDAMVVNFGQLTSIGAG